MSLPTYNRHGHSGRRLLWAVYVFCCHPWVTGMLLHIWNPQFLGFTILPYQFLRLLTPFMRIYLNSNEMGILYSNLAIRTYMKSEAGAVPLVGTWMRDDRL